MRRENRKQSKLKLGTTVYITGGILLIAILAFVITFIVYSNKLDSEYALDSDYLSKYNYTTSDEDIASASTSIGKTVEESKNNIVSNNSDKNEVSNESTNSVSTTKKDSESKKNNTIKNKVEKDPEFVKPISGDISKEYAKDSLIYSETLKEWITHLGVDIKAGRATVVKSAADGTVKYIKNDPRYGLTIIIEHSNGFETRYANLLTTEFVSEGEEVEAGQTIGTVGDSAIYEIVDESHLHFEILKNSESVNPCEYIKFD